MKENLVNPISDSMSIRTNEQGGYELANMTKSDLRSLHTMIRSACLPERQTFNRVKEQIEKILGL